MDTGEKKQNAAGMFKAAWDDFMANPVCELSELEYLNRRCREASDLDPCLGDSFPPAFHVLMGSLYFMLGMCAAEKGLEKESRAYYQDAIRMLGQCSKPTWEVYLMLSRALREVEEPENSIAPLQRALELAFAGDSGLAKVTNDQMAEMWEELGGVYVKLDKPADAADSYEWAILYRPDSKFLQAAIVLCSWFAGRFDRIIEMSRTLCSDSEVGVPPSALELLAVAAIRTNRPELAVEAYEKLLAGCKNPDGREFYSRRLGYVEGHRDSCADRLLWNAEGFRWVLWYDRYDTGGEPQSPNELVELLRKEFGEEVRDPISRLGLLVFALTEKVDRISSLDDERTEIRDRLRNDVFGEPLWKTLGKDTQDDLVQGELVATVNRRSRGNDYSDTVIKYARAFNFELRERILLPFGNFMAGKRLMKLRITNDEGDSWDSRALGGLSWVKMNDLFEGWHLIVAQSHNRGQNDLRFLLSGEQREYTEEFLEPYKGERGAFVIDLVNLLPRMRELIWKAEHNEPVAYAELLRLRSDLMGFHSRPGLLIRLVLHFPLGR